MTGPKISLITVCYNAAATIESCIQSVLSQSYSNIEYIIIDGASADGTLDIIKRYGNKIDILISEADNGLYDAMNKGIKHATGDVIGILNADDYFAANDVLDTVAEAFSNPDTQIAYGDMDMVNAQLQPVRQWRSGAYNIAELTRGWMPPHATFYTRKHIFEQCGNYNLNYGTAADYELMLRILYKYKVPAVYLARVLVKMRLGGVSNGSISKRVNAWANDYKAMKKHGVPNPAFSLLLKPLRKLKQYFIK